MLDEIAIDVTEDESFSQTDAPQTLDCDDVDVQTPPVSEWQDERNSRPLPY
jgi:hypothetical protein